MPESPRGQRSLARACLPRVALVQVDCPATVATDPATGALLCQDGTGAGVAWVVTPSFDISQLDPESITAFTSWGFFVTALGFISIWGIKQVVRYIRSV